MSISFRQFFENNTLHGLAYGKTVEDIAKKWNVDVETVNKVIEQGAKIEKEHTNDPETAKTIAKDHIFELGLSYYDALDKMESKLKKK